MGGANNGRIRERIMLSPYGRFFRKTGTDITGEFASFRHTSLCGNLATYQGHLMDYEIETHDGRHRGYSPWLQRFLARDPREYADSLSRYQFARQAPLHRTDPDGRVVVDPSCGSQFPNMQNEVAEACRRVRELRNEAQARDIPNIGCPDDRPRYDRLTGMNDWCNNSSSRVRCETCPVNYLPAHADPQASGCDIIYCTNFPGHGTDDRTIPPQRTLCHEMAHCSGFVGHDQSPGNPAEAGHWCSTCYHGLTDPNQEKCCNLRAGAGNPPAPGDYRPGLCSCCRWGNR